MCSVVRRDKELCVSVEDDGLHGGHGFMCVFGHVSVCVWPPLLCCYVQRESMAVN